MKNERHPIDDLFQRGLNQHSVPPPMHIWERIEESRGNRQRGKLMFLKQQFTFVSSAAAVLLIGVWLGWPETPQLGSFPFSSAPEPEVAAMDTRLVETLQPEARQAGLLPDVGKIIEKKKQQKKNIQPAGIAFSPAIAGLSPKQDLKVKGVDEADLPAVADPGEVPAVKPVKESPVKREPVRVVKVDKLDDSRALSLPSTLSKLDAAPMAIPETGCARFSEGRPAVFLALTAGPALPGRNFESKSDEYLDYAQQRNNTESVRISYGASARLSVVFPWGGAIRSGVSFTQLNEQLVYRNSKVRQTTITDIFGPNGEVIGTDTSYIIENTILKYNNRHRMIDIPLQLGYEVRYNKLTLAANAGINLNVAYSSRGNYLGPKDLLPTRFDSDNPDLEPVYKTKIGLGWQASMGLHYQVNDRLDLMAEPYLLYYPNSFTRSDYPLSQKYLAGGVGFGLRVLL